MKILILGGYGVFGGRLAQLLRDEAGIEMLIAGRNLDRARRFCKAHQGAARMRPVRVDRRSVAAILGTERPHVLVDASGPFQAYGEDPYVVLRACIAAGVRYPRPVRWGRFRRGGPRLRRGRSGRRRLGPVGRVDLPGAHGGGAAGDGARHDNSSA
jgi:hypothetical protein